jgi:gamma-glutamylcyclotransferase (GGCT)/AIG2-like uncharacterized protein YtfP
MNLFCYGSLQFPTVMRAVVGRDFEAERAALVGYARYRVRDAEYPGLVPEPGARTEGTLYRGLDDAAIRALDHFEGAFYARLTLEIELASREREAAEVYVVVPARRGELSRDPWDAAHFERHDLERFMRRIG